MTTRFARVLLMVLMAGTASVIEAQPQAPLRGGQSPGPRFLISTLVSDGTGLGFQVANAVRARIASDFDMKTLWVVPESLITRHLENSGYRPDQPLTDRETKQLVSQFRADELIKGVVTKTASGSYRVEADWSLTPRDDMVQPLPAVEAEKISDVAKLVAREFHNARRQVEAVQRCNDRARARDYAGALTEARKAINAYPRSVIGRICIANVYDQQKFGADSMLRIATEILSIHPTNRRALSFAADAYGTKGMAEKQLETLESLFATDTTSTPVRVALARVYAAANRFGDAKSAIRPVAAQMPDNLEVLSLLWRIQIASRDWKEALNTGEIIASIDSSAATVDFFERMISIAGSAGEAPRAVALADRAMKKFPMNDALALIQVQVLRNAGDLPGALAAVSRLLERNPRVPNAWLQKARLESELRVVADTVLATLTNGVTNGEDKALTSQLATAFAVTASRDSTRNENDRARLAIRYIKVAETAHASDTTALVLGSTSLQLAQRLAVEIGQTRKCENFKEAQDAIVDAQISLPKAGARQPDRVLPLMRVVGPTAAYIDQLSKTVCKSPD
jgi:predicted Zn-dependent protease